MRTILPRLVAVTLFLSGVVASATAAEVRIGDKNFTLPDGFTVELVAGPPLIDRPIVADFDELGRLYVAESSGSSDNVQKQLAERPHRILRLEDSDGDGVFDRRTVFADHMMFPEGTMWRGGSLYVAAPPSIWKLTDADGDGAAEQREEWFDGKTLTGCANDLHGPYLGLDGWIYWCKGAFAEQKYERPESAPWTTRAAHIFRRSPNGKIIEPVMTGGMDNPVEVVFTPGGERIFTTTFLQNPAGGRRDGLIHAVYGGVYGKVHDVIDGHPRTSRGVMPVLSHLGPAAPCGLVRYESDVFGADYDGALFAALFNLHKVTRHQLKPAGATFESADADFLTCDNFDFHPTDVLEDADGSLLVLNTGGWYKLCCPTSQLHKPDVLGAIYRIRKTDAPRRADPRGLQLDWTSVSGDALANLLADERPAVRKRAMATLAAQADMAIAPLAKVIKSPSASTRQRLAAVWTAARIDAPAARAMGRLALGDSDATVRQAAAHVAGLYRDTEAAAALRQALADESPQVRRAAAEALGRVGDPAAAPALLAALAVPHDAVLDHSLTYALIEIHAPAQTAVGLTHENPMVRRAAMAALDQMGEGKLLNGSQVAAELTARDESLRDTAAWIAGRHPEWGDELANSLRLRLAEPGMDLAIWTRQISELAAMPAVASMLAKAIVSTDVSDKDRTAVLAAMGAVRPASAPAAWTHALAALMSGPNAALADQAVLAAVAVEGNQEISPGLREALAGLPDRQDVSTSARLNALAMLSSRSIDMAPAWFELAAAQLDSSQPAATRLLAVRALSKSKLSREQLLALTRIINGVGPLEIDALTSAFSDCTDDEIGRQLVDALKSAKARTALRADSLERNVAKFGPAVRESADRLLSELHPDIAAQQKRLEELLTALPAGDIRRGQGVFNSAKAACTTCHTIGYVGGTVGPDLTAVGKVRTRRDILESIVFPSASFVQSYEPVMVDTRQGQRHAGVLRRNDDQEVMLITGPQQEIHIPRPDVKEVRPSNVSVMPTGLDQQLSQQELSDLATFLLSCK